jgi:NADH-quinone oxidoreductase subunit K
MNEISLLYNYLAIGGLLFALGMLGFLVRRNMIVMFLSAEMMLQGISLSLVAWGRYHGSLGAAGAWGGQMLVIFIITIAACEAGIAMALVLMLARKSGNLDTASWQDLREEGQPPFVDREVPEDCVADHVWPTLTPAGIRPAIDPEDRLYRPRV